MENCKYEQHVEAYFGLPGTVTEKTVVNTDFGQLVNLLAMYDEKPLKQPDQTIQGDNYSNWLPEDEFKATVFVMNEVIVERKRQHAKWGQRNDSPVLYATILNEEIGEVNKEVCEYAFGTGNQRLEAFDKMRTELIQSAAVIVAMITCMDRNQG